MSAAGVVPLGTCRGCGTLHPYRDLIDHDTPLGFSVYLCASCFAGECS